MEREPRVSRLDITAADEVEVRCLVVDDYRATRRALLRILFWLSATVDEAETVREAVARLQAVSDERVITDVHMSELDGLTLVVWFRKRLELTALKVIVLANATSVGTMSMARKAGADPYLLKPVTETRLGAAVRRYIAPRGRQRRCVTTRAWRASRGMRTCLRRRFKPPAVAVASTSMATERVRALIERWRGDPGGTYRSWFLWEERWKNFRAIRRGLRTVVDEIAAGTFGTAYRGSSLEVVVASIAEQRQIFRGADHAFLWKPKLRIPDIYEDVDNQRAFGRFLDACTCCNSSEAVVAAIQELDRHAIKGVGPASANLLYFLHPTLVPPFNTAIVKGYNALTRGRVKLGKWTDYLAMRAGMLRIVGEHRDLLSNDLGAVAGLLFDIGQGRYPAPPPDDDVAACAAWEADLATVRAEAAAAQRRVDAQRNEDVTHTEVQGWLSDLGRALGFAVWVAANDRGRDYRGRSLGTDCLDVLPSWVASHPGVDAVRLIDVLWIDRATEDVVAAFEVEHTTSIYSGIVRMLDLALGAPERTTRGLFLVAPDARESDVRAQLERPAFRPVRSLGMRFLPYSELEKNREAMARFGRGLHPIEAVSRSFGD